MLEFWWRPLALIAGLALFSSLFSSSQGNDTAWAIFSCGLIANLVYHLRQLRKFSNWLSDPTRPPLQGDGVWGDALYQLEKQMRGRQGEQQKVAADLEQMLEATRNLPDGVVILDDDNRIVWLNIAATERCLVCRRRGMKASFCFTCCAIPAFPNGCNRRLLRRP
jgi:two-component system, OmpR family, phosphate regulon sensor histidine kinase PhoR